MKVRATVGFALACLCFVSVYGQASALEDAVLYFDFEQVKGDVVEDLSNNGNVGTIHGGAKSTRDGKFGAAMELDGADDFITVEDSPSLDITDELTLSIWFKTKQNINGFWVSILGKHLSATDGSYLLFIGEGGPNQALFYAVNSKKETVYLVSEVIINDGGWHHVAGVYDGSEAKIYVDGVLTKQGGLDSPRKLTDHPVTIGKRTDAGNYFKGKVDDVAIFKRALSEDEVERISKEGIKALAAVDSSGKLASSWGAIKATY